MKRLLSLTLATTAIISLTAMAAPSTTVFPTLQEVQNAATGLTATNNPLFTSNNVYYFRLNDNVGCQFGYSAPLTANSQINPIPYTPGMTHFGHRITGVRYVTPAKPVDGEGSALLSVCTLDRRFQCDVDKPITTYCMNFVNFTGSMAQAKLMVRG
jgi:hypothetical protein